MYIHENKKIYVINSSNNTKRKENEHKLHKMHKKISNKNINYLEQI